MENHFSTLRSRLKLSTLVSLLFCLMTSHALAWGGRGHALVCEAAIHLVQEQELKHFLLNKSHSISYLCNAPDTYWRSLKTTESEGPTHFLEPDLVGLDYEQLPLDFSKMSQMVNGKKILHKDTLVKSAAKELGSIWWRADQFARLAKEAAQRATKSGVSKKDDEDVFEMLAMMGLLGHYVADNSQPLHTTFDYDGWGSGHGGIHSYYESELVNAFSEKILGEIVKAAKTAKKELALDKNDTIVENMRKLSILSHADLKKIYKLDPLLKPSKLIRERGMELKTEAERKSPSKVLPQFAAILTLDMARGALLLAHSWEQIYRAGGKPPLSKDKSYRFPHQYPFVEPDYLKAMDQSDSN